MKLHSDTYDTYKNSEGEWAEKVPVEWQEKRVKDIFRMVTDAAPGNNDFELLSLYASIGVRPRKDLDARGNKASSTDGYWIVKKGDIVVNKLLAWMGSVGLSEYDGVTSPAYDILRKIKSDLEPRYFSYLFRTEVAKKIFKKNSRGIMDMRLRLYFDKLGAITVPVPPYSTQMAIANYIDTKTAQIDKKIELLSQKLTLYRKLKQPLIHEAVTRSLDKAVSLKDSKSESSGKTPKHWDVKRIKGLVSFKKGKIPKIFSNDINDLPYLSMDYLRGKDKITHHVASQEGLVVVNDKDLLILWDGANAGEVMIGKRGYLSSTMAKIKFKKSLFNKEYFYYILKSMENRFKMFSDGTTIPHFSPRTLTDEIIGIPSIDEQKEISSYLDIKISHIDNGIDTIIAQIGKLKELRIAMIKDAVTGKIKIAVEENKKGQAA